MEGISRVRVTVRGISRLVIHAFSEKAKKEMLDKQKKVAKKAKEARDPQADFEAAKYYDSKGRECAPITALKKSMVSAATGFDGLKKVAMRQALFCHPADGTPGDMLIPIETPDGKPAKGIMREDAVTISMSTRGLAFRPEYPEWQLRFIVEYNPRLISLGQLRELIGQAGWGVGICEGRPEKTSALGWGRFEVSELVEL